MNRAKAFFTSISLAVFLLFSLSVPAHAITTLTSTPLFVGNGLSMVCAITNVGPASITVTVQVISFDGAVLNEDHGALAPGRASFVEEAGPHTFPPYCKITGNFNRGFVRASAQIMDSNRTTIAVVPAQAVGE